MRACCITILFFFILLACQNRQTNARSEALTDTAVQQPDTAHTRTQISAFAKEVLTVLKNKDHESFARFIHPVEGVRFSPYGYIDTAADKVFSAGEFLTWLSKKPPSKITWGQYDGTGEPIALTIDEYFKKFVYNVDFLNAPQTGFNEMIGKGNSLNNLTAIYKNCAFTEHHFPGFDQTYNGMDWCSLRLVFKNYNNNAYIVGIVHDQWTI